MLIQSLNPIPNSKSSNMKSRRLCIQLLRERLSEKMCTRQSRKVLWDMINTLFLTLELSNLLLLLSFSTRKHISVASRATLSNFLEELEWTQNHLKYLSGWSRTLFPKTFLEVAVKCDDLYRNAAISRRNQDCNHENCVRFHPQLYVKILFCGHKSPVAKLIKIYNCKCDVTRKSARGLGYFVWHLKSEDSSVVLLNHYHSSWLFFCDLMYNVNFSSCEQT